MIKIKCKYCLNVYMGSLEWIDKFLAAGKFEEKTWNLVWTENVLFKKPTKVES